MKWFGDSWDALICDDSLRVKVPVGEECWMCLKPIRKTDRGLVLSWAKDAPEKASHLHCTIRFIA